jgi:hypothetical protein
MFLCLVLVAAMANAEGGDLRLRRVDHEWGLAFRHHDGSSGRHYMVETNGSGVVLFDYDDDGDEDVFLGDGANLPGTLRGDTSQAPSSRLFRNDGGVFADLTEGARIEIGVYVSGGAAGDVDGDGDLDLYVTAFGANLLWRNDGDGSFTEIGGVAGVDDSSWSSSAAFADVDHDGDLDLYVANYVDFTLSNHKACGDPARRLVGYCGPDVYRPSPDRFYRNRGDGTFEDATRQAGLDVAAGAGLALSFADLDDDGWIDLYVANDLTPNFLFKNRGGTFEDISLLSGTAYGDRGFAEAGMGVAAGDYDGDGDLDLVVSNYEGETQALYANGGGAIFTDKRYVAGLAEPTLRRLAFGIAFADLDHDGDLDLVVANGHVRENAADFDALSRYRQPNQVFENRSENRSENRGGRFFEVPQPGWGHTGASRGLATGDLDGDGDLDLVITNVGDEVEVYENLLEGAGAWTRVDLRASVGNRFGVGARIELEAGGRRQIREVTAGSSYMSQSALTAHFGLGAALRVERLTVRWNGDRIRIVGALPAGLRLRLSLR